MAVGHQVIVKYTYLDMCNGWVGGYVVGMGEWLHELFEVFFKFSASHPISNILYPHDWIYIYIIIYIYCNIFTHVSILRNLMLYTLYIICTIYICIACLECIICITYTRKHSPCSSTGRSRTLLRSWRTGEFKKHRDEPWLSGVQTWVLTMNNRDLTNNNGIIIEVSWDFFDLIWLLGASEPEPGRFFIAWPFSWENDD